MKKKEIPVYVKNMYLDIYIYYLDESNISFVEQIMKPD